MTKMSFQHEPSSTNDKFDHHQSPGDGHDGPSPRLIAAAVVAAVIVIFIVANHQTVKISFWLFQWETTVRWSIFIAMLLGVALDRLFIWGMRRREDSKRDASKKKWLAPPSKD